MQHADFTITKASGQPRKPRNQGRVSEQYIADLEQQAAANGIILSNLLSSPSAAAIPARAARLYRKPLMLHADVYAGSRSTGAVWTTNPRQRANRDNGVGTHWKKCHVVAVVRAWCGDCGHAQVGKSTDSPLQTTHPTGHSSPGWIVTTQVQRIVAGRRWRKDGQPRRSPQGVVVNSVRGTPHTWARALALNDLILGQCWAGTQAHKRMVTRREKYLRGITKHRGAEAAATVVAATETYVKSLAHLDVHLAVAQVNLDSGYKVLQI